MKKLLPLILALAGAALLLTGCPKPTDAPDPAPTPKEDLVLTNTTAIENVGTLKFADMTGYPADFKITDYATVEIIWNGEYGQGKFCLNNTAGGDAYNYGYGDGYGPNWIHDIAKDADGNGKVEIAITADMAACDCITYQDFAGAGTVTFTKVTFKAAK